MSWTDYPWHLRAERSRPKVDSRGRLYKRSSVLTFSQCLGFGTAARTKKTSPVTHEGALLFELVSPAVTIPPIHRPVLLPTGPTLRSRGSMGYARPPNEIVTFNVVLHAISRATGQLPAAESGRNTHEMSTSDPDRLEGLILEHDPKTR